MKSINIMISFSSEKTSDTIAKALSSIGFSNIDICRSGADVKKLSLMYDEGIVICGYKLKDTTVIDLADNLPDEFSIILIGNRGQIDMCDDSRVVKLTVPIKNRDLTETVSVIANLHLNQGLNMSAYGKLSAVERERIKLIEKAKVILMLHYSMTEEQAHRYIQKQSMDNGIKMTDVAAIIIKNEK